MTGDAAKVSVNAFDFDLLYKSMYACKKNVLWKDSVAHFYLNGISETLRLSDQIRDGTYEERPPHHFMITYPKQRHAISIAFRDRVYQRSLNDNFIYPAMVRSFILDNCACQIGKGTDFARSRLKKFMHDYFNKHGVNGYLLRCDIKGYYENLRHDIVKNDFRKRLPPEIYEQAARVLDNQYAGPVGFNPGSQMVQIAGISSLDKLDHYIKEQLHIRWYIRYMDDFILIYPDKTYLEYCRKEIERFLSDMTLRLHPKKTFIRTLREGTTFLGFHYRFTETGKVLMLITPDSVKRMRKHLYNMRRCGMSKAKMYECYQCWRAHAGKGDAHKAVLRMDQYFKSLWRN